MKNRRVLSVVLVLGLAVLLLAGCSAAPRGATVDPNAPPEGVWQALVVFPLAKALTYLHLVIAKAGIPYSYGWAIIIFTVIIKLVTLPLSWKSMQSSRAMQVLQPQLQELQKKYAKDRETLAQKQMALYKEAGVSPLGGCLPMLIQFPILIGLYNALYRLAAIKELTGQRFFWIPDLAFPGADVGTSWLSKAWQAKDWAQLATYLVLPLLLVVTQIIMQKMTQASTPTTGDQQQGMMNQMFMVMSVMFGWITLGVPSGLALYWVVSNLLQMVQQYFMVNRYAKAPVTLVLPKGEAGAKEDKEGKKAPEFDVETSDLVLIKGIGGKTAAVLAEAGIVTFADLAASDAEQLQQIMTEANIGSGQRDYEAWIRQAAKLERETSQQQENGKG